MTPRERAEMFAIKFRGQANHLAFQFGGPIYLVGSYLHAVEPGDIDIRCLIAREDLELWFGSDPDAIGVDWNPASLARCREELSDITGEPIQDDRTRIRLDAVPLEMLRAGKGDP